MISNDPLSLAKEHHKAIADYYEKIAANASCIGQLLRGRRVVLRVPSSAIFTVSEIRVERGSIGIYAKTRGRPRRIATSLDQIEVV